MHGGFNARTRGLSVGERLRNQFHLYLFLSGSTCWLCGEGWAAFAQLDTRQGGALNPGLLAVPELHTTFEGDFGDVAGDVLYLHGLTDRRPRHKVFIFPR